MTEPRTAKLTARISQSDLDALTRIAEKENVTLSTLTANRIASLVHQHEPRPVPNQPHEHESAGAE